MKKIIASLALFAAVCSPAMAASFKSNVVPADSKIAIHVDMEAFRSSELGAVSSELVNSNADAEDLKELTEKLGFDPTKELASLTAYAPDLAVEKSGWVMIAESVNPVISEKKIVSLIKEMGEESGITSSKSGSNTIYSLANPQSQTPAKMFFMDSDTLLAANDDSNINAAIKAYKGKTGDYKAMTSPAGSFFAMNVAGFQDLEIPTDDPQAQMVKQVKSISCYVGESKSNAFLALTVTTLDPAIAAQLHQMAQGMLPFMAMQMSQEAPDLAAVLQKLQLTQDGSNINLKLEYPAKDIAKLIKKMAAEQAGEGGDDLGITPISPVSMN